MKVVVVYIVVVVLVLSVAEKKSADCKLKLANIFYVIERERNRKTSE